MSVGSDIYCSQCLPSFLQVDRKPLQDVDSSSLCVLAGPVLAAEWHRVSTVSTSDVLMK